MAKLGTGVTMIEVAQALGYYCNPIKLSELVKHPNINKWSACKPIQMAGYMPDDINQMETVMGQMKYGLEMSGITGNTDERMMSDTITASQGDCWYYSGVTVSASYPGRLGDFRHYNPDAPAPFDEVYLEYNNPGIEYVQGPMIQLAFQRNTQSEINPYNMTHLRGTYHILYRKKNTTTGYTAASTAVTSSFTGLTSARIQLTSGQTGDYEACAAIRRGGGDQEFYPLPNTYFQFSTRNMTKEEACHLQLENRCSLQMNSTIGRLSVALRVRNIWTSSVDALVTCRVYDSRNELLWYNTGTTITVPAGGYVTLYGDEEGNLSTTSSGTIRIEDIRPSGTFRPPIYSTCTAKNTLIGNVTIQKDVTLLDA